VRVRKHRSPGRGTWSDHVDTSLYVVGVLWIVFALDALLALDLRFLGIVPRNVVGLRGILFAPFLHAGLGHIVANSGALFFLLLVALLYSRRLTRIALIMTSLLSNTAVWLLGPAGSVHIGASGVIFGLIGFLSAVGFSRGDRRSIFVTLMVLLLYGGAILSLGQRVPGVSWQMHLAGFISGVLCARWTRRLRR